MDNRTYRSVELETSSEGYGTPPTIHGKKQIDWLIESLKYRKIESRSSYPSSFNLICMGSQVLATTGSDSYFHYKEEFQYLIDRLVAEDIQNVIFLSGDVHFGEVNKLIYKGGGDNTVLGKAGSLDKNYVFYEITSSPLTAGPWAGSKTEDNKNRVDIFPGEPDRVGQRNFASLTFEGSLGNRRATIRYYDSDGKLLNAISIGEKETVSPESVIFAQ
jgi:alkaline phosphatase D